MCAAGHLLLQEPAPHSPPTHIHTHASAFPAAPPTARRAARKQLAPLHFVSQLVAQTQAAVPPPIQSVQQHFTHAPSAHVHPRPIAWLPARHVPCLWLLTCCATMPVISRFARMPPPLTRIHCALQQLSARHAARGKICARCVLRLRAASSQGPWAGPQPAAGTRACLARPVRVKVRVECAWVVWLPRAGQGACEQASRKCRERKLPTVSAVLRAQLRQWRASSVGGLLCR